MKIPPIFECLSACFMFQLEFLAANAIRYFLLFDCLEAVSISGEVEKLDNLELAEAEGYLDTKFFSL